MQIALEKEKDKRKDILTSLDTTDADKLNVNRIACPELDEIYATHQVIVKILLGQQKILQMLYWKLKCHCVFTD